MPSNPQHQCAKRPDEISQPGSERKADSRAPNYVTKVKGAVATANKYSAPQLSGKFQINSTQQSNGWSSEINECATAENQQSRQQAAGIP